MQSFWMYSATLNVECEYYEVGSSIVGHSRKPEIDIIYVKRFITSGKYIITRNYLFLEL